MGREMRGPESTFDADHITVMIRVLVLGIL